MADYGNMKITDAGRKLEALAKTGNYTIQFDHLETGNGEYTEEEKEKLRESTALKSMKQSFFFSNVTPEEDYVSLKCNIKNEGLQEGYYISEIGIYAKMEGQDTILYAIEAVQNPDYMPARTEEQLYEIVLQIMVKVYDAEKITITFNSQTYALAEDLVTHQKDDVAHIKNEERLAWNEKMEKDGDGSEIAEIFVEAEMLENIVSGEKHSTIFGKVAKAIADYISHKEVEATDAELGHVKVDNVMSAESDNPVRNKVVNAELEKRLEKDGNASDTTVEFTEAAEIAELVSGEEMGVIVGKMATGVKNVISLNTEIADMKGYIGMTDDDIYGVEVDFVNSKFTRLAGAANRTAGSGFDDVNAFGGRRRCNVTNDGVVVAYYGDAGFSTTGKLTQAVTVGSVTYAVGTIVQVMVEQPKFYYKVVPLVAEKKRKGAILRKARYYVSDTPKAGFKLHPAFVVNGQENEYVYLSAFEGTLWDVSASAYILDDAQVADFSNDMFCSIAGARPASGLTQSLTITNIRKLAEKRGAGWEQATIQTVSASQILMLIEYASFNMQTAIGMGDVSKTDDGATNMAEYTGATVTLGNASGEVTKANGIKIVSYRGEENLWGNIYKWIDGINEHIDGSTHESNTYIADHGFVDGSGTDPYANAEISVQYGSGYISAFCYSEKYDWLFVAGELSGNSALPVGDFFWSQTGWRCPMFGQSWGGGLTAGAFCYNITNGSVVSFRNIGGRITYRKYV